MSEKTEDNQKLKKACESMFGPDIPEPTRTLKKIIYERNLSDRILKRMCEQEPCSTFGGCPVDGGKKDSHGESGAGWIGVDLDGTLAHYEGWRGPTVIGKPIPKMVDRVVRWIQEGPEVRIMTARVFPGKPDAPACRAAIEDWLKRHVYSKLPASFVDAPVPFPYLKITHEKDPMMLELWDDRCVQVIPNTGDRADGKD